MDHIVGWIYCHKLSGTPVLNAKKKFAVLPEKPTPNEIKRYLEMLRPYKDRHSVTIRKVIISYADEC